VREEAGASAQIVSSGFAPSERGTIDPSHTWSPSCTASAKTRPGRRHALAGERRQEMGFARRRALERRHAPAGVRVRGMARKVTPRACRWRRGRRAMLLVGRSGAA